MADSLTFTLRGHDELSRVLNGTADSADRLRLRMAGVTADASGQLRDLQGRFLTADEAQRRLAASTTTTRRSFGSLSDAASELGEKLKASLINLAPAAIPAAAATAQAAGAIAVQLGAVAVAAAAYTVALKPQIAEIGEAVKAQEAWEDALRTSGATSQDAMQAQAAYQQQLDKMPPATRKASIAVGLLRTDFQAWSDALADDVMEPFNKGVAIADTLLPKTSGLVRGASTEFDRLITMVGGAIMTPGFDRLTGKVTDFSDKTLDRAVDKLRTFIATLDTDKIGGNVEEFLAYAKANGPAVWETLENIGDALINVLQAGSDVGVGMLSVVNVLSRVVAAVPPEAIATLLQLAVAIKVVKLAAAGIDAARIAVGAFGTQLTAMSTAASAAPGALGGARAAIGSLSRGAKVAMAGAGLGLLLVGLTALGSNSRKSKPDVEAMTTAIGVLGNTGKVTGEAIKVFGSDLSGLAYSVDRVAGKSSGMDKFNDSMNKVFTLGLKKSNSLNEAKDNVDALDEGLASLVNNGNAALAAAALDQLNKGLDPTQVKELRKELDSYTDALAGQALEQKLSIESMGLFGQQAHDTQAQLDAQKKSADGLRESIQALNDVNRKGLGGEIAFEAAIDAATDAAKKNHGVLKMRNGELVLTTDKQRDAASALNDLAAKTDEATAAARDQGKSWEEIQGTYQRGRDALIKTAQQMGLTKAQAKALADQILATPDKTVLLQGDVTDLQAKLTQAKADLKAAPPGKEYALRGNVIDLQNKLAKAQRAIDKVHGKTVTITYRGLAAAGSGAVAVPGGGRYASGGPIGNFRPGGGLLRGPGTPTSDSILLWGSTGEFMMRAAAVDKYGVQFMEAINEGRLPASKAAPRAGLPAAGPGRGGLGGQDGAQLVRAMAAAVAAAASRPITGEVRLDSGELLGVMRGQARPVAQAEVEKFAQDLMAAVATAGG